MQEASARPKLQKLLLGALGLCNASSVAWELPKHEKGPEAALLVDAAQQNTHTLVLGSMQI